MKTAVIYARVRGVDNPEQQIQEQIATCTQYANENGITIVDIYVDIEGLGSHVSRLDLKQLLNDSHTATWDTVIVYSNDRIARKIPESKKISQDIRTKWQIANKCYGSS